MNVRSLTTTSNRNQLTVGLIRYTYYYWPTHCKAMIRSIFSERELTFTFAICYRPPVSIVCLSVCNVRAPYSAGWSFRKCFFAIWYLGHPLTLI